MAKLNPEVYFDITIPRSGGFKLFVRQSSSRFLESWSVTYLIVLHPTSPNLHHWNKYTESHKYKAYNWNNFKNTSCHDLM